MDVSVNSDPEPRIIDEQRIQNADLSSHPCVLADVLPASVENTDSPVTFRFRCHHSNGVEESPEMTVSQRYGGRIAWDMSGLSSAKLDSAERLEIAWYPRDHPPESGFDHNGRVFVDNVHITDDQNQVTQSKSMRKHRELERAHGFMTEQVIQSETDTTQDGVYKYSDGTEVPYHLEILQNGNVEETCDGDVFVWEVST